LNLALLPDGVENAANLDRIADAARLLGASCSDSVDGRLIAVDNAPGAREIYGRRPLRGAATLAVGNERRGLSRSLLASADETVVIPTFSRTVTTLNVAAAAAVAGWYILRGSGPQAQTTRTENRRPALLLVGDDHVEVGSSLRRRPTPQESSSRAASNHRQCRRLRGDHRRDSARRCKPTAARTSLTRKSTTDRGRSVSGRNPGAGEGTDESRLARLEAGGVRAAPPHLLDYPCRNLPAGRAAPSAAWPVTASAQVRKDPPTSCPRRLHTRRSGRAPGLLTTTAPTTESRRKNVFGRLTGEDACSCALPVDRLVDNGGCEDGGDGIECVGGHQQERRRRQARQRLCVANVLKRDVGKDPVGDQEGPPRIEASSIAADRTALSSRSGQLGPPLTA
jgi:SpoU rRNA Methylase family